MKFQKFTVGQNNLFTAAGQDATSSNVLTNVSSPRNGILIHFSSLKIVLLKLYIGYRHIYCYEGICLQNVGEKSD